MTVGAVIVSSVSLSTVGRMSTSEVLGINSPVRPVRGEKERGGGKEEGGGIREGRSEKNRRKERGKGREGEGRKKGKETGERGKGEEKELEESLGTRLASNKWQNYKNKHTFQIVLL